MRASLTIDTAQVASLIGGMADGDKRQALEDAGQIIINSTKVG